MKTTPILLAFTLAAATLLRAETTLENEYLRITLEERNLRIVEIYDKVRHRDFNNTLPNDDNKARGLGNFENHDNAFPYRKQFSTRPWKLEAQSKESLTYSITFEDGVLLRETFTLRPGESKVAMSWEVINPTREQKQIFPWFRSSHSTGTNKLRGVSTAHERKTGLWRNACVRHEELGVTTPAQSPWCARSWAKDGAIWYYCSTIPARYYNSWMNNIHTLEQIFPIMTLAPGSSSSLRVTLAVGGDFAEVTSASENYAMNVPTRQFATGSARFDFKAEISGVCPGEVTILPRIVDPRGNIMAEGEAAKAALDARRLSTVALTVTTEHPLPDGPYFLEVEIRNADSKSEILRNAFACGELSAEAEFFAEDDMAQFLEKPSVHHGPLLERTDNMEFFFADSLEIITPSDTLSAKARKEPARLELARNEGESFFIAARPRTFNFPYRLRAICTGLPEGLTVKIAPVKHTLQGGIIFGSHAVVNGRFPEVILEDTPYICPNSKENTLFHVEARSSGNVKPGIYKGEIRFICYNHPQVKIPLEITVWDFTLPAIPRLKTDCGDVFGEPTWLISNSGSKLTRRDYVRLTRDMLLDHRLSPRYDPLGDNPALWEKEYAEALAAGASHFCIGCSLLKRNPKLLRMKGDFFDAKGALDSVYTYPPFDEINHTQEQKFIDWVTDWRATTRIPVMLTYYKTGLFHMIPYVDVWARPLEVSDYTRAILKHGGALYCVNPPGTTTALDFPLLKVRSNAWMMKQAGYTGSLLWATANVISSDKWNNGRGGDSFNANMVLLTEAGVLPSVRLKAMRDGQDDYDYLCILEENAKRLKSMEAANPLLAETETLLATDWMNSDALNAPASLRQWRRRIADLIVKTSRELQKAK
ncbi:MAG: DUF4091 domain-containing protein [Victivallales bacterium]|nr:DUF4091 domain-containing protein [Victivallales bacterium]